MIDDDSISNESTTRSFADVLDTYASRRSLIGGGLAAVAGFFAGQPLDALAAGLQGNSPGTLMNFTPVPVKGGGGGTPRVAAEYTYDVLIPCGSAIAPGKLDAVGIGHDGMWYFPIGSGNAGNSHGLLVLNHEYGDNIVLLGKNTPSNIDDVRYSQYMHGMSVVEIKRSGRGNGVWRTVNTLNLARRIHGNSPVQFSGPVAGSPLLRNTANNPYLGTLNNCANGYTPWGTYLTCEENFNGYFGARGPWTASAMQRRYGLTAAGFGYGWHTYDDRFDLSNPAYANEGNRFGWIVELDPTKPFSEPVKRTALGRFKHEGVAITVGRDGRIVGYMGDDERFDYIYKFVSDSNWQTLRAKGLSPLDHGKLYAAKFNDDGTGNWLELTVNDPKIAAEFKTQAEVLTYARRAGDLVGATPMDRPEWTTVAPNGLVYCTLTNNSNRGRSGVPGANAANPMAPNPDGHIIRWLDSDQHVGLSFNWEIFVLAKDTHGTEDSFASPDGLWADPDGRLFIQTDGAQHDGLNDQMLVADIYTGEIRRLFEGVWGAEVTGLAVTPDRKTLFCNLQHPDPTAVPGRDATIVIMRKDGGVVGS
jgi:secreted PhoX family phosphatase